MTEICCEIGVVLACRRNASPWAPVAWRPAAALAAPPPLEPGAFISEFSGEALYYAGAFTLTFHSSETGHYRDNLRSGRPCIWIATTVEDAIASVRIVTADPYEGEALAETYGEGLDAVAMPQPLQELLAAFVEEHHVERTFFKRKRS